MSGFQLESVGIVNDRINVVIQDDMHESCKLTHIIKRDGQRVTYDPDKIRVALTKAFAAVEGGVYAIDSKRVLLQVTQLTEQIHTNLQTHSYEHPSALHIETIQDQVELALMRAGHHQVARAYVLYRERRHQDRHHQQRTLQIRVLEADGKSHDLDGASLQQIIKKACADLSDVDPALIWRETARALYDGMPITELDKALIMSSRALVERDPNYSYVTARFLLRTLYKEATAFLNSDCLLAASTVPDYSNYFFHYINKGVALGLLSPQLQTFDLHKLAQALVPQRDQQFTYLGLQILYDRYFLHSNEIRFELPQAFFMRVAMGLAIHESEKEQRAIEFYQLLSKFDYMVSTPTLFNSGTLKPQLSSCFLSTIPDDLDGIYSAIKDNALLSKFSGGLGNDWTPVRAMGARIKGTNGKSLGVVPFLNVANASAVAVNQGGKRKGAVCAYLEIWHLDIEEFLELRKNTGDDRRRTHDMNTASWIPDLFMKRVLQSESWTLFSPDETPDLHDLYGLDFERRYEYYERQAEIGKLKNFKKLPAVNVWRKLLNMLFETGHPWITFKDTCNLRSPQQHAGVIHSSNLCTEITLNTSAHEVAVCNLGSVNLAQHINSNLEIDREKLKKTVRTAMRMLDNVIDINYYTIPQARHSNLTHRPVGLGMMGFQDALYQLRIPYASEEAVVFADRSMELISYYAIEASSDLSLERGAYSSFSGSLWSQGILPIDSLEILQQTRANYFQQDRSQTLDWDRLRHKIMRDGMRHSNCMAIAPTATIASIFGVTQSIEPTYQNLFAKSNMSGDFTVINPYLVKDLKKRQLWDSVMINDLKYEDGSVKRIDRIPIELKQLYETAFEFDTTWLIEAASRRQKWLDQSQSLNLYLANPSGKKLDALYKLAWLKGLKTTYYLRTLGATHVEKSTASGKNQLNAVSPNQPKACSLLEPDCEACQ